MSSSSTAAEAPAGPGIIPSLRQLAVPIDSVRPLGRNPRRGDVDRIKHGLVTYGQYRPVLVRSSTGDVLVGNHTWRAAKALGWSEVAASPIDVADDDEATRLALWDNKSSDGSTYDLEELAGVLSSLADLEGSGWLPEELAALLPQEPRPQLTDEDDVPPVGPPDTISQDGSLWLLGGPDHRLLCGSARLAEDVDRLLDGEVPDAVFTDPPYGVDYTGKTAEALKIRNDNLSATELGALLLDSFGNIARVLRPGGVFYICSPSGHLETAFRLALIESGLGLHQQVVWVKDRFVLGRQDYHQRHESIHVGWIPGVDPATPPLYDPEHATLLYGWKPGAAHDFHGGRRQDTVWEFPRPSASRLHPTMKPTGLVRRAIENSTVQGELVLDLFGGSGSTAIAAYASRRRSAMMELDPVYVDVICRRWQEHTGLLPIDAASGEEVDFVALLEAKKAG